LSDRTPEERQRAAEERAARRASREHDDTGYEAHNGYDAQAGYEEPAEPVEPLPTVDRRTAVADRPPMSRAARAQRVGRPGRPTLPPSSPKPRFRRSFRRLLALLALVFIGAALWAINSTFQPFQGEDEEAGAVAVRIPEGSDARSIGKLLEEKGVIEDARFFELNATVTFRRRDLITGRYVLRRNMTNGAAIEALMQGPEVKVVKTFDVTIPEGLSIRESAKAINQSGIRGNYRKAVQSDEAFTRARKLGLPKSADTLEGFLFPATYTLEVGATASDLVDKQLDAFQQNLGKVDLKRAARKNLDEYDVVKIASLIERETPSDKERPLVSSVIYNRLSQGEPLGIDATTRYYEKKWSGQLLESELADDNPFNTRLNGGLPPTPIGAPGLASLKAAAKPAKTDLLFYTVKPGACHAFAETLEEHERNVARYQAAFDGDQAPPQKC
jgi:uncharacterized YceG family protein